MQQRFPSFAQYDEILRAIDVGAPEVVLNIVERHQTWLGYHGHGKGTVLEHLVQRLPESRALLADLVGLGMSVIGARLDPDTDALVRSVLQSQPLWRREAHDLGILEISIAGGKAWSLSFVPGDGQYTFRYGPLYDAAMPVTIDEARDSLSTDLLRRDKSAQGAKWFRPTLERIALGEDVSLGPVLEKLSTRSHAVQYAPGFPRQQ